MTLSTDLGNISLATHGAVYLVIAGLCLLIALHQVKRLLIPIGPLVRAVAAVCLVIFCLVAALVLLIAALAGGR